MGTSGISNHGSRAPGAASGPARAPDDVPQRQAPALSCRGVVKRYGDFTAVDGVDLDVRPGEIFALLGPNGAGKTTLINCITGLSRHTAGRIEVFGHDVVRQFRTARKLVGLVPQEINFDPFFTPLESLMNQMGLMGVRPDVERAEHLLRTFSLLHRRDAYTRQLSGGMKRRLLVAKALVHAPRLLFLDEPTAGVDVELRKELWNEVRKLRDGGTTIILTTHYLEEAEQLADRIGVIRGGQLILVEQREQLLRHHRRSWMTLILDRAIASVPAGLPDGSRLIDSTRIEIPWDSPEELQRCIERMRQEAAILDVLVQQTRLEDIFVALINSATDAHTARNGKGGTS